MALSKQPQRSALDVNVQGGAEQKQGEICKHHLHVNRSRCSVFGEYVKSTMYLDILRLPSHGLSPRGG